MILPDYPIADENEDELRRVPLAKKVAEMVSKFEGKDSFVIGIEGPWGAGKSSFVNLVLKNLTPDIAYFIFNPWNFSDEESLLRDFFLRYSEIIDRLLGKESATKIKKYAASLSTVDLGLSYHGVSLNPLALLKLLNPEKSLKISRDELNGILAGIKTKIVVVIDDIDRLDVEETKLVLKLVKLTADFPNTIFILAYDRDRVEQRITDESKGMEGREYLKKIIQVSFSLPEPDKQDIRKILVRDLDKSIENIYGKVELVGNDETRWNDILIAGFFELFKTIRDIKRYISSLRLDWSIMGKDDVNIVDFIAIESIRVFAPKFYDAIPDNRDLFMGMTDFRTRLRGADGVRESKERYKELLKLIPPDIRVHVDKICQELFPSLDSSAHSAESSEQWTKELRVCSEEKFDFYFQLGVPAGAISEIEAKSLISLLDNREDFNAALVELDKQKKLRKVLNKILTLRGTLTVDRLKTLISVLWSLEGKLEDTRSQVFDFDDFESQANRIAYNGIKDLVASDTERAAFIKQLLDESATLYLPVQFVAILIQSLTKGDPSRILVSEAALEPLKVIAVEKIKTAADSGDLPKAEHMPFLLYRWSEWESLTAVQNYLRTLISTRDGLFAFLRGFVGLVLSSAGNYKTIDRNSINGLIPLTEMEAKLAEIPPEEIEALDAKTKEAISLFQNPPSRF